MDRVPANAQECLSANAVHERIFGMIPYDDLPDQIQRQKHATPVNAKTDLDGVTKIFEVLKPNAVVLDQSSKDEADIDSQHIKVLVEEAIMSLSQQKTTILLIQKKQRIKFSSFL